MKSRSFHNVIDGEMSPCLLLIMVGMFGPTWFSSLTQTITHLDTDHEDIQAHGGLCQKRTVFFLTIFTMML